MKKNTQLILIGIVVFAFVGLSFLLYPSLPANIPMQWGLNGKVNYTLPTLPVVVALNLIDAGFGFYNVFAFRKEDKIPGKAFIAALVLPVLFAIILLVTQIHF